MNVAYGGLIAGGVAFLVISITSGEARLGGAVAWGLGFGTAIYSAAHSAIKAAEQRN